MRARCFIVMLLAITVIPGKGLSQQFGGTPPSLAWKQLNTNTARIIFHPGLERQAAEIAAITHRLDSVTRPTIGGAVKKVNIVLQNQTTNANGYVSLAPFRSEFYLTPPQNSFQLGSLPWSATLALHEYRHIQQFNNFRKGLSKLSYLLFGEEGLALANSAAIPDWFWEGDAVFQETLESRQGRGRLPYFFNDYRALWAAGKEYSWMKLRNGSYRDLVPDHYRLGYMLTAYGREKYGAGIWAKITGDAARYKGLFYPFQKAVKKYTGEDYASFRNNALAFFKQASPGHLKAPAAGDLRDIASSDPRHDRSGKLPGADVPDGPSIDSASLYARRHRHFVANTSFPQWIDAENIIYVKSSYRQVPVFSIRNIVSGEEKKLRVRDVSMDNQFSYRNGRIVYAALLPDLRWGWRDYGAIQLADIHTGRQTTVTRKTKYFSPDISSDGSRIVAVHAGADGNNQLHIIDALSGEKLQTVPNPDALVYTYPKFYKDSGIAAAVRNRSGEMALGVFDMATGEAQWLTPFGMQTIGYIQTNGDTICFTMSDGMLDRVYIAVKDKVFRFRPTNDNLFTGDYQLSIHDNKYALVSFTAVGNRLTHGNYTPTAFLAPQIPDSALIYPLRELRGDSMAMPALASAVFPITPYSRSFGLFNFHSWRPYIDDPDYSYALVGQNVLNTFQSELFGAYNRNERFKEAGASLAYGGLFPVISGGASYTFDRSFEDTAGTVNWDELNARLGLSLPLNLSRGRHYRRITFSAALNAKSLYYTGASKSLFENKHFNSGELSLTASNQSQQAVQHIYPRFAQAAFMRYRSAINQYSANQLLLSGTIYLPGVAKNHSLVVQAAYQRRDTLQQYYFSNSFSFSRGYTAIDFPRMWKWGINYHFPMVYPDAGFGNLFYLLRIRGNLYYDHTEGRSLQSGRIYAFRTAGAEIYFDSKWWNQQPFSFGFRYSRLLDTDMAGRDPNQWALVLPVNLIGR